MPAVVDHLNKVATYAGEHRLQLSVNLELCLEALQYAQSAQEVLALAQFLPDRPYFWDLFLFYVAYYDLFHLADGVIISPQGGRVQLLSTVLRGTGSGS